MSAVGIKVVSADFGVSGLQLTDSICSMKSRHFDTQERRGVTAIAERQHYKLTVMESQEFKNRNGRIGRI